MRTAIRRVTARSAARAATFLSHRRYSLGRCCLAVIALALAGTVGAPGADLDAAKLPPAAAAVDFGADIQPLLENACVRCHGADKQKGKFRLDTRAVLMS